jgi:hypothetical protein
MNSAQDSIRIVAKVDIAESIRRGKPASHTTASFALAEVAAEAAKQGYTTELAELLYESSQGDGWRIRDLGSIPTADVAGFAESFARRASLLRSENEAAKLAKAEREAAQAKAHSANTDIVSAAIRADVSKVAISEYGTEVCRSVDRFGDPTDRVAYYGGVTKQSLPADCVALYDADAERRKSLRAVVLASEEAAKAALEQRITDAVQASLSPVEKRMQERGVLDISAVRNRILDRDVEDAIAEIAELLGDGYHVESGSSYADAMNTMSVARYRLLDKIEAMLSARVTPMRGSPKGKLRVKHKCKSPLGRDVWVFITFPADVE